MARGKYANRAARRREDEAVTSEIEAYKHNVRKLTEENKELRDALAKEQASHREEVRALRAQLAEGLSPEIAALERELNRQRDRADQATRTLTEVGKRWGAVAAQLADFLAAKLGTDRVGGVDAIREMLGYRPPGISDGTAPATYRNPRINRKYRGDSTFDDQIEWLLGGPHK